MNTERNIDFYIDRAVDRSGSKSDRALSFLLGMGQNAINFYRAGKALPSDDTMIKLARIAGVDPAVALLDLNMWRSEGAARETYISMLKKLTTAAVVLIFLALPVNRAYAYSYGFNNQAAQHQHYQDDTLSHRHISHSVIETIHYHIIVSASALLKSLFSLPVRTVQSCNALLTCRISTDRLSCKYIQGETHA